MRLRIGVAILAACATFTAAAGCGGEESGGGADQAGGGATAGPPPVDWTIFGRIPARTHYLAASERFNPPLKRVWSFNTRGLIEFPPAVHRGIAYVANKYGDVHAVDLTTREVLWNLGKQRRDVGPPSDVTAPVYAAGRVFVAYEGGVLVAIDAGSGRIDWKRDLRSRLESSPIVIGGRLFIGTDKTDLVALDAASGKVRWRFNSPAPIKASPSYAAGRIFVGDYRGTMYALKTDSGKVAWTANTTKTGPGGSGGFYSSPAIASGRVYAARDDGRVFAFDAGSGRIAWTFLTGGPVYGSPAVARVPGTPPTVYIGSYDSHLYALDARTGRKRWRFDVGGPVPGTATVIGHTVYTSSFKTGKSIGIDVRTHRKNFSFDSPGYTPMISDGRNLYLVGYFTLHALRPR